MAERYPVSLRMMVFSPFCNFADVSVPNGVTGLVYLLCQEPPARKLTLPIDTPFTVSLSGRSFLFGLPSLSEYLIFRPSNVANCVDILSNLKVHWMQLLVETERKGFRQLFPVNPTISLLSFKNELTNEASSA